MIKDKIEYLLWLLGTDNTQLAAYAGCSESNFSRLRSGSRLPAENSQTVKRFASAVCGSAEAKGRSRELADGIGLAKDVPLTPEALTVWLFSDSSKAPDFGSRSSDTAQFGLKLDTVMELVGMTNSRLSRTANVDPSYISRMRSGKRLPKNNSRLISRICTLLVQRAEEQQLTHELRDLIGEKNPAPDEQKLSASLLGWLCDRSDTSGPSAIVRLIETIDASASTEELPSFSEAAPDSILSDTSDQYFGTEGLRNAVIRFLGGAALAGNRTIGLYSDQNMNWMRGSFTRTWMSLMNECVNHGVRFTIIHNVERSLPEMLMAISCWMPLYLTGNITPYYSTRRPGELFACSMFTDPGRASVQSFCVKGSEAEAEYRYITDSAGVEHTAKSFNTLLSESHPLVRISDTLRTPEAGSTVIRLDKTELIINDDSAAVNKLSEPRMCFSFDHPMLVRAFRAYADSLPKNK